MFNIELCVLLNIVAVWVSWVWLYCWYILLNGHVLGPSCACRAIPMLVSKLWKDERWRWIAWLSLNQLDCSIFVNLFSQKCWIRVFFYNLYFELKFGYTCCCFCFLSVLCVCSCAYKRKLLGFMWFLFVLYCAQTNRYERECVVSLCRLEKCSNVCYLIWQLCVYIYMVILHTSLFVFFNLHNNCTFYGVLLIKSGIFSFEMLPCEMHVHMIIVKTF